MKKSFTLLFAAALMLFANVGWSSAAAQQAPTAAVVPKLYLDGKALEAKVPPAIVGASVLVPVRIVTESLGYKVGFDSKAKQVSVKKDATEILMTLGNPIATVNGKSVKMTEPPILQADTTLIPIRFVVETFGLQILWDNSTKSAFLYTDGTTGGSGTDTGNQTPPSGSPDPGTPPGNGGTVGTDPGTVTNPPSPNGNESEVPPAEGNGQPETQPPVVIPTHLKQIKYETDAVVITYDGQLSPMPTVLTGPDRLVVDLPNADFSADFLADFTTAPPVLGQIAEMAVPVHEALQKIRYAQFQTNPNIARVVLDFNQAWGYQLLNDASIGEMRILLSKPADVPVTEPVKDGYTVVLDAGHGGSDPGAKSVTGKWEKDFNLSMVKKVQAILASESKIHLVMSRDSDTFPTLDDRVNLANSVKADLFVSIHGNSFTPSTNGTETYYNRPDSLDFATLVHKNLVKATGFKDNGVRNRGFRVIKATTMPAVLLEVGYLSNASNEKEMYSDAFQDRVAASIAASIKQYFNL